MTKHKQTIFGFGKGNCFSTCIACLMDLTPDEVPNFCQEPTWLEDAVNWLKERGVGVVYAEERGYMLNCYAIATGRSPRWKQMAEQHPDVDPKKFLHSVIVHLGGFGDKDQWVHDPHPDDSFIEDVRDWIILIPAQRRA
jgi:Fe-S-cluster formation regulator IscX/YfhJ